MIELYSYPTSNGQKLMIMLEETGLPWRHIDINIRLGDQFSAEHLQRSPNNKIPAIIDSEGPGGKPYTMMESNAILFYLAEKTGQFLPADPAGRYDVLQWLIFQSSHLGPMMGQANHFNNHTDVQYGKDRYTQEVARLLRVFENRLAQNEWVGGSTYSIADIAIYPWCRNPASLKLDASTHPAFMRWHKAVEARAAVQRANAMAGEIRQRMDLASDTAEADKRISLYDTRDNLDRLARATAR
jgi:GST-like protein